MLRAFTAGLVTFASVAAFAAPAKFTVDKDHSKIGFSVRHLMISDVTGVFKDFDGSFTFDADKDVVSEGKFIAQTASISTDNAKRDDHLKSPDFFDAAKYPTISFTDSKIKKVSKDKYKWTGELDMHGVKKPVTFDLEHKGTVKDPWGNTRAGFEATATIKRGDWNLKWNKPMEAGAGMMVSDEVKLVLTVEAVQAKDAAAAAAPAATDKKKK